MNKKWYFKSFIKDKTNFPNKLLLTDTQVSRLCKNCTNNSSANIKLSKIQLRIYRLTFSFVNDSWFTVNEKLLTPLAQSIRMHLALTEATSASDAAIQKNYGSGTTAVTISKLLIKASVKQLKMKQKSGFPSTLLCTLTAGTGVVKRFLNTASCFN